MSADTVRGWKAVTLTERSLEGVEGRLKDLNKGGWPGAWKKLMIKQWSV